MDRGSLASMSLMSTGKFSKAAAFFPRAWGNC